MTNMLRFLIFLFLGAYAYLTLNEKSNYSRYPLVCVTGKKEATDRWSAADQFPVYYMDL